MKLLNKPTYNNIKTISHLYTTNNAGDDDDSDDGSTDGGDNGDDAGGFSSPTSAFSTFPVVFLCS